jgi:hypothetical protein
LVKQRTEFRGQWGITQDNYGRLFYNVNDSQLRGDVTPPGYIGRNANYKCANGLNLAIATNQNVFPIRMNTGVNRGYRPDVLDTAGRLREFTAACAPVIYRGDNFPAEFQGNAFVCEPGANLIKRNIVFDQGLAISSKFAYPDHEFLASTDERFRPVNAYNSPDGTLYVVDMYRGILQHRAYMTTHLRNEILSRGLDKLHEGSRDDWDEMIDTNVKGVLHVDRAVVPLLVARGRGTVIHLGSIAGHQVYPGGNVYCASKHAVRALNEGLRLDLLGTGVLVATVDPGMVAETEFSLVRFHGDAERASAVYRGMTPLSPRDVAEVIVYVATRPPHVNVAETVLLPTDQAGAMNVHRRTEPR